MNIIRNAGNKRMSTIAGEMINFEVGKRLFVNGAYIAPPKDGSHEPVYGNISVDGVKLLIKPTFGFLFIDQRTLTSDELSYGDVTDSKLERWTKLLAKKIQDIEGAVTAAEMTKYGRKMAYFPLETGEDGFTSTKMRSKTFDTKYIREGTFVTKTNLDRAIVYGGSMGSNAISEYFGIARFTWIIYPFERLLNGIAEAAANPRVDKALLGYFSFVYDPNFFIKSSSSGHIQNGIESLGRELKLTDFSCVNDIMPIYSGGLLKLEDLIDIANKNAKGTKDDTSETSTSPDSQDSAPSSPSDESLNPTAPFGSVNTLNKRIMSEIGMESLMKVLKRVPIETLRFPGYIPGISEKTREYRIVYCPKRLGAIELMRQFGIMINDYPKELIDMPIRAIPTTTQVFEIRYVDVSIDNAPAPNDVCKRCKTPLYDSIYLLYVNQQDKNCTAYCQICMHSVFNTAGEVVHGTDLYDAHALYHGAAVLAKTMYPRSVNQVIDMIPNDKVREIVRGFYSKTNTMITTTNGKLLFINCTTASNKAKSLLDSKIYIGAQDMSTYLEYCYGNVEGTPSTHEFLGAYASVIYQNSILFPIAFAKF